MDNFYKAPAVVALRLPMIWMNAVDPTRLGQREVNRMFTEKMAAAWLGAAEANVAAMTGVMTFWTSIWLGALPLEASHAYLKTVSTAALAPTRKTIGSNARRLARRKRR